MNYELAQGSLIRDMERGSRTYRRSSFFNKEAARIDSPLTAESLHPFSVASLISKRDIKTSLRDSASRPDSKVAWYGLLERHHDPIM